VVKISPEWVIDPQKGKSSGRIATFSLWTGMFRYFIGILNNVFRPQNPLREQQ